MGKITAFLTIYFFNTTNMETQKRLEVPKGLNDCTLTDIDLLREWLENVFDQQRNKVSGVQCDDDTYSEEKEAA